ncbi:MAG: hypothetical protein H6Q52_1082 [Deltaproteobacteria bacterium]|nr:hypothetical protein [Deltaproteobacteria bacterium]
MNGYSRKLSQHFDTSEGERWKEVPGSVLTGFKAQGVGDDCGGEGA